VPWLPYPEPPPVRESLPKPEHLVQPLRPLHDGPVRPLHFPELHAFEQPVIEDEHAFTGS
jgi:hypothetical protein